MFEDEINSIALADPAMVRYLLALLPADAVAGLDTSRLRRLPTKQIGRGARKHVADMAWAVGAPTPEHPDAEVLLLVEFQSAPHPRMALRMESYVALLRQEMAGALPDAFFHARGKPLAHPAEGSWLAAGAAGAGLHRRPPLAAVQRATAGRADAAGFAALAAGFGDAAA